MPDLYDELPGTTEAVYDYILTLDPHYTPLIEKPTFKQKKFGADDVNYNVSSKLTVPFAIVTISYDAQDPYDIGIIFDLFCDNEKAFGQARSFKWEHPLDNHVYVVKFWEDIEVALTSESVYGIPIVRLAIIDRVDDES